MPRISITKGLKSLKKPFSKKKNKKSSIKEETPVIEDEIVATELAKPLNEDDVHTETDKSSESNSLKEIIPAVPNKQPEDEEQQVSNPDTFNDEVPKPNISDLESEPFDEEKKVEEKKQSGKNISSKTNTSLIESNTENKTLEESESTSESAKCGGWPSFNKTGEDNNANDEEGEESNAMKCGEWPKFCSTTGENSCDKSLLESSQNGCGMLDKGAEEEKAYDAEAEETKTGNYCGFIRNDENSLKEEKRTSETVEGSEFCAPVCNYFQADESANETSTKGRSSNTNEETEFCSPGWCTGLFQMNENSAQESNKNSRKKKSKAKSVEELPKTGMFCSMW